MTTLRLGHQYLSNHARISDAILLTEELVRMHRILCAGIPLRWQGDFAHDLERLGDAYQEQHHYKKACELDKEALAIRRVSYDVLSSNGSRSNLAKILQHYSLNLSLSGQSQQACLVDIEAISLRRELYAWRPHIYRAPLSVSLRNYCIHLGRVGEAHQLVEAVKVGREALRLGRTLFGMDRDGSRGILAECLRVYSCALKDLGLEQESQLVMEELQTLQAHRTSERGPGRLTMRHSRRGSWHLLVC